MSQTKQMLCESRFCDPILTEYIRSDSIDNKYHFNARHTLQMIDDINKTIKNNCEDFIYAIGFFANELDNLIQIKNCYVTKGYQVDMYILETEKLKYILNIKWCEPIEYTEQIDITPKVTEVLETIPLAIELNAKGRRRINKALDYSMTCVSSDDSYKFNGYICEIFEHQVHIYTDIGEMYKSKGYNYKISYQAEKYKYVGSYHFSVW